MNEPYEFKCMMCLSGFHQTDVSPTAGTNTQAGQKTVYIYPGERQGSGGRGVVLLSFLGRDKINLTQ